MSISHNPASQLEVHEHHFVSGPRNKSGYGKDGKWHVGGEKIKHSHPGGDIPRNHPHTGPSNYGYGKRKITKRPTGEQGLEIIPRTEEQNTFTLVVTDSALMSVRVPLGQKIPGLIPIGDTPIEALGFPAADRIMNTFKMKCIARDERTKKSGGAS